MLGDTGRPCPRLIPRNPCRSWEMQTYDGPSACPIFAVVPRQSVEELSFSLKSPELFDGYCRTMPISRYALDRRIFAYRKVVSDSVVASAVVILSFCASVTFIVLFLGVESMLEGINAARNISRWVSGT